VLYLRIVFFFDSGSANIFQCFSVVSSNEFVPEAVLYSNEVKVTRYCT